MLNNLYSPSLICFCFDFLTETFALFATEHIDVGRETNVFTNGSSPYFSKKCKSFVLNHNLSIKALIISGKRTVASPSIVTLSAFSFTLPHDIASRV